MNEENDKLDPPVGSLVMRGLFLAIGAFFAGQLIMWLLDRAVS
jgi:hypothetical protein